MQCAHVCCRDEATMALRTTRPTRPDLRTMIYYDESQAPKTASRYCARHGALLVTEMVLLFAGPD